MIAFASNVLTDEQASLLIVYADLPEQIVQHMSRIPHYADRDEMRSAALYGMVCVVRRFDPTRGVSFHDFAKCRILGSVMDYLRELDHLTRKGRQQYKATGETELAKASAMIAEALDDNLKDDCPRPSYKVEHDEQLELMRAHVRMLPHMMRRAVKLRYFCGYSSEKVARRLGVTMSCVGIHCRTAIERLQKQMKTSNAITH